MDHLFLDANCVFDLIYKRDLSYSHLLEGNTLSLSVLSIHITFYLAKEQMPYTLLEGFLEHVSAVPLDTSLLLRSTNGPTSDFEDNVQLNSAVAAQATHFLTRDKKLLQMKKYEGITLVSPDQL